MFEQKKIRAASSLFGFLCLFVRSCGSVPPSTKTKVSGLVGPAGALEAHHMLEAPVPKPQSRFGMGPHQKKKEMHASLKQDLYLRPGKNFLSITITSLEYENYTN